MMRLGQWQAGDGNDIVFDVPATHRAGSNAAAAFDGKEVIESADTFTPDMLETEAFLGRLTNLHAAEHLAAALRKHSDHLTNFLNKRRLHVSFEWPGGYLGGLPGKSKTRSWNTGPAQGLRRQMKTGC